MNLCILVTVHLQTTYIQVRNAGTRKNVPYIPLDIAYGERKPINHPNDRTYVGKGLSLRGGAVQGQALMHWQLAPIHLERHLVSESE